MTAEAALLEPPETAAHATVLSAQGLSLGYAQAGQAHVNCILRDFSLELRSGEIVALLGPSGVGKSSLLRTLAGLQAAQAGVVRIHGEALKGPHPKLGFVFQDPCLLPWLTLEENVGFGLDFRNQPHLDEAQRSERVRRAIAEVGLTGARTRYPDELSGGMAQRTSLARGLARAPEILLLDEPFSALDEVTRSEMQTLLLQITTRHHTSAILVTHDIDEAIILADRILLIGGQPGQLIGQWEPDRPHPRDETDPHLTTLRVEILQALRAARAPKLAS